MKAEFYILEHSDDMQILLFTCELIENKMNGDNKKIYIHTHDMAQAKKLDVLLWTFKDISFLPHNLADDNENQTPICIGHAGQPLPQVDCLFNLSANLPNFSHPCQEIIEIVAANAESQQAARERYRHYRELGYQFNTHKINVKTKSQVPAI